MNPAPSSSPKPIYLAHHEGQILGPFEPEFIELMVAEKIFRPDLSVQEPGQDSVFPFNQRPSHHRQPLVIQANEVHTQLAEQRRKSEQDQNNATRRLFKLIGIGIVSAFGLFFVMIVIGQIQESSNRTSTPSLPSGSPPSYSAPNSSPYSASNPAYPGSSIQLPASTFIPPPPLPEIKVPTWSASNYPGLSSQSFDSTPKSDAPSRPASTTGSVPSTAASTAPEPAVEKVVYRDAEGNTYWVSNYDYHRLLKIKQSLDTTEADLTKRETELTSVQKTLVQKRGTLDQANQYQIDQFNRQVEQFNALNEALETSFDDYNRRVHEFNAELQRVGTFQP